MSSENVKISLADVTCHYQETVIPGVSAIVAVHREFRTPICHIWWQHALRANVEILNVYTVELLRRQGVATKALVYLAGAYDECTISTAVGNDLSTPWLKKNLFSEVPLGWVRKPLKALRGGKAEA